jgi:hypothetical protein
MEQRPLRLGDIVDDYCPRERRLTNHAIVAIVEQTIKQTRCTTCDHEHVYKEAREPRRRKKDETSVLYSQVLSGLQKPAAHTFHEETDSVSDEHDDDADSAPVQMDDDLAVEPAETLPVSAQEDAESGEASEPDGEQGSQPDSDEPWPMHRRLIRAQLPRTGNEPPPARPLPEFTVRQPGARGGQQRQWGRGGASNGNGNHAQGRGRGQGQGGGGGRGRGFAPPRPDGRGGPGGGRPGGGRGRRSR